MTKSKFSYTAFLPLFVVIVIISIFILLITKVWMAEPSLSILSIFAILFFIFILSYMILGEIRTRLTIINTDAQEITCSGWFGMGPMLIFRYEELEGYSNSYLPSADRDYESIYIIRNGRKIMKLSSFYHSNYTEMKAIIASKLTYLGEKPFNLLTEIREIFS